jgi:hypothetical protein
MALPTAHCPKLSAAFEMVKSKLGEKAKSYYEEQAQQIFPFLVAFSDGRKDLKNAFSVSLGNIKETDLFTKCEHLDSLARLIGKTYLPLLPEAAWDIKVTAKTVKAGDKIVTVKAGLACAGPSVLMAFKRFAAATTHFEALNKKREPKEYHAGLSNLWLPALTALKKATGWTEQDAGKLLKDSGRDRLFAALNMLHTMVGQTVSQALMNFPATLQEAANQADAACKGEDLSTLSALVTSEEAVSSGYLGIQAKILTMVDTNAAGDLFAAFLVIGALKAWLPKCVTVVRSAADQHEALKAIIVEELDTAEKKYADVEKASEEKLESAGLTLGNLTALQAQAINLKFNCSWRIEIRSWLIGLGRCSLNEYV